MLRVGEKQNSGESSKLCYTRVGGPFFVKLKMFVHSAAVILYEPDGCVAPLDARVFRSVKSV